MTYPPVAALILIVLGVLVLVVAYRGHCTGCLPAGSNFLRAYRPNRDDNWLAFHLFLALYVCGGTTLVVWGLLILTGLAPAPPIR
jgi:hypothetical protein